MELVKPIWRKKKKKKTCEIRKGGLSHGSMRKGKPQKQIVAEPSLSALDGMNLCKVDPSMKVSWQVHPSSR